MQGDLFTMTFAMTNSTNSVTSTHVIAENLRNSSSKSVISAPYELINIDTTGWEPGPHAIKLYAKDNYSGGSYSSYPTYVNVYIETTNRLAFAEMLVSNIVDEASVTVTNVRYTGVMAASTNFIDGEAHGIEIDEGVIMTSGAAELWSLGTYSIQADEDDSSMTTEEKAAHPGNEKISSLVGDVETYDAAMISIATFAATDTQLECSYQFGSEEYLDYVGEKNDAPLMTVSGIPVLLLPQCSDIVSVDTIHAEGLDSFGSLVEGTNDHLFISWDMLAENNGYNKAEYNGLTIKMNAYILANGQTFKDIAIAIADAGDQERDSAFLIKNSSIKTINFSK